MRRDMDLKRDVLEELAWEPSVDAAQIGVMCHEGVVTLTGHVGTHSEKHAAGEVTKRVHGVLGIANELEVRPADSHLRDDEHIAAAAVHALQWDAKVPSEQLLVTVEDGHLTLEGVVGRRFEKSAAGRAVRHLVGVRGIKNAIVVDPATTKGARRKAHEVKAQIEAALRRNALVNSRQISVDVIQQKVVLTGDVHSPAEHEEVERIAWTAHEVDTVENCVTITPWGTGAMEEWGY